MDPQQMQKLAAILKASGQVAGPIGQALAPSQGQGQGGGSPMINQGRPGQPPPQMSAPPPITFSTQGAGAAMPVPVAPPPPMPFQTQQSDAMMSKLDPKGAATYSAIQGVSQILGQWTQRKQQKQQQEAANIAQNLMQAIQSGDQGEVQAILNDPKATKVLNKVYKGWLTPAPQEKPQDPDVQAFTKGIADYQSKASGTGGPQITGGQATSGGGMPITNAGGPQMTGGGGRPPQGQNMPFDTNAQKPQGQPMQQGGMPRQVGGYMLPQSLPQDLLRAAQGNAAVQKAQNDPNSLLGPNQLTSQEMRQTQLYAAQLEVSPKELAILDTGNQRELMKAYARIATEELKQNEISKRVAGTDASRVKAAQLGKEGHLGAADITGKAGIEKTKIAGQFKLDAAKIIKDAKGKSPDELTKKILDTQIKSFTSLKNSANTQYEQAMKNDNPQAATIFKQQMDSYDTQINSLNSQMDDIKAAGDASEFNKQIQFLLGTDATEPPPDEEDDDASTESDK